MQLPMKVAGGERDQIRKAEVQAWTKADSPRLLEYLPAWSPFFLDDQSKWLGGLALVLSLI